MKRVSKDGVITVEESKGTDTYVEEVLGMQFDRGYLSPYFITDTEKMISEYYKGNISEISKQLIKRWPDRKQILLERKF